jgi:hypothetical protein
MYAHELLRVLTDDEFSRGMHHVYDTFAAIISVTYETEN